MYIHVQCMTGIMKNLPCHFLTNLKQNFRIDLCQNMYVFTLVPSGSSTNSLGSTKTLPDILSFLQWEPTQRNACMFFVKFSFAFLMR